MCFAAGSNYHRFISTPANCLEFKRIRSSKVREGSNGRPSASGDPTLSTLTSRGLPSEAGETRLATTRFGSLFHRSPSPGDAGSGLGLHVLHTPESPFVDIIFVHGLGGHSRKTWSKNHDPTLFWPELWLPFEPEMDAARIFTFGYNANWRDSANTAARISDFAKDLLYEMRFAQDGFGESLDIGSRPIFFVVHSMGGLVVKKLMVLGLHDETYKDIITSISAIIFLSTPHRGTNLAETLNRILAASFQSPKSFVSDLEKNSPVISDLNEQFRHFAPRLSIWSFYETLATTIGPKKMMVLEKDSSVLGYPTEISRPLNADHHDVCKYSSPSDNNYISVRNAIRSLVLLHRRKGREESVGELETGDIQELFRGCTSSDGDYNALQQKLIPGTCEWLVRQPEVASWIRPSLGTHVTWYHSRPGSGKSVRASFLIKHLRTSGSACQFFLFKASDSKKRSVVNCLRSLACQLASALPAFKKLLKNSSPQSLGLDTPDPILLWQKTFERRLFQVSQIDPVYWVIDGLDECDSPKDLLYCLQNLTDSKLPIKVMILSRNTRDISSLFDRLSHHVFVTRVEENGMVNTEQDIRLVVQKELEYIRGSQSFKSDLLRKIVSRSEGNFLWTRLVLDEIIDCHTEDSVRNVLDELPDDMLQLYQHMEQNLVSSKKRFNQSDASLARALLEWTTCAQRPLNVAELLQALKTEFLGLLDLKGTVKDICGQFILVDNMEKVVFVHQTAREYFTSTRDSRFYIESSLAHRKLLKRMLQAFEEPNLPLDLKQYQHALQAKEPFLFYTAVSWSYHLGCSNSAASDAEVLKPLLQFLKSHAPLSWIHALALVGRLDILVRTSKVLFSFTQKSRKLQTLGNLTHDRLLDLDYINSWASDILNVAGKFGNNLTRDPMTIYDIIPAFCPSDSVIRKQLYHPQSSKITISATNKTGWNDRIGRFGLPNDAEAWNISCAGKLVAVLGPNGVVALWNAIDFSEVGAITHGEPVTAITLSDNGGRLATYGLATTKIWAIPARKLLSSTKNPLNTKAMVLEFSDNDGKLLVGGDDNVVRHIRFDALNQGWQIPHPQMLRENRRVVGALTSSPTCVAFDGDNAYVGASYAGAPLSVWRLNDGKSVGICKRAKSFRTDGVPRGSANWFSVKRFTWNPVTGHILGIYKDGCVFKWHPLTDENVEEPQAADEIAASPNGLFFATSSSNGSVQIWNSADFSIIYRLSLEDLVTGLVFSPDSCRVYDLRGGWVNAWEPSCLTRSLERDEHDNGRNNDKEDRSLTDLTPTTTEVATIEAITALAPAPDGRRYCVGYEDGRCLLFPRGRSEGISLARFYNYLDVTNAVWSRDGCFVAVADLAGEVQVKSLLPSMTEEPEIISLPNPHIELGTYNVEELLFSASCKQLLVATTKSAFVCSVEDGTLVAQVELQRDQPRKWLCHPNREEVILSFGAFGVEAYSWDGLVPRGLFSFQETANHAGPIPSQNSSLGTVFGVDELLDALTDSMPNENSKVDKVMLSQDKKQVLLWRAETSVDAGVPDTTRELLAFPGLELVTKGPFLPPSFETGRHTRIQPEVAVLIKVLLGFLPSGQLVFIDHDLWLCSFQLDNPFNDSIEALIQRLYFIPRDWFDSRCLGLCSMAEDGTLFWPRDGYVELIECDINEMRME